MDGLNSIQRLAQYNPNVVIADVHSVVVVLNAEVHTFSGSVFRIT